MWRRNAGLPAIQQLSRRACPGWCRRRRDHRPGSDQSSTGLDPTHQPAPRRRWFGCCSTSLYRPRHGAALVRTRPSVPHAVTRTAAVSVSPEDPRWSTSSFTNDRLVCRSAGAGLDLRVVVGIRCGAPSSPVRHGGLIVRCPSPDPAPSSSARRGMVGRQGLAQLNPQLAPGDQLVRFIRRGISRQARTWGRWTSAR